MTEKEDPAERKSSLTPITKISRWQWWFLVFLMISFVLIGQGTAILLLRFYYEHGGKSKWTATLAQNAGFPILFIPFILFPRIIEPAIKSSIWLIMAVYLFLGLLIAGNHLLFSIGLEYLSASTYTMICATKLAFGAVFSVLLNSQKFTCLIMNSVVVLSLSACLVGVSDHTPGPPDVDQNKYTFGLTASIAASALYAFLLSITQLSFTKLIRKETFAVVLELQIFTSIVASCASLIGLFASGEWKMLRSEIDCFHEGSLSYAMTLIWTAVAWQICSVGVVGLIFIVSSLFSNVIGALSLPLSPLVIAIVYNYTMDGAKIIAVILGVWGVVTYVYQYVLDGFRSGMEVRKCHKCPC